MKSTALLSEDHKHMLRAMRVVEAMAMRAQNGSNPNARDVKYILAFLSGFGDRIHQGREESVFFPALLRDREQRNYHKLRALIFEHNRQRSLIEGLQDSLLSKEKKDSVYCANRLVEVLRRHIDEEEHTLVPLAASTLTSDEDTRVAREIETQDKIWNDKNTPSLLRWLDSLESIYCVKTPTRLRDRSVV
jgi:hemerythrin-like domain-containing protein